jgi:hypothetical protein
MVQKMLPEQEKTPGPGPDTEKIRRIAIIVVALIVLSAISFIIAGGPQSSGEVSGPSVQSASGGASRHATGSAAVTAAPKKAVAFVLVPGDPVSCGLTCREMTAAITNTGYADAHNVCISLTMQNSKGEAIALNGNETLVMCIGDLGAGQQRSEPVTINADCGMFALKCVKETLTLRTVVSSDEITTRFSDTQLAV